MEESPQDDVGGWVGSGEVTFGELRHALQRSRRQGRIADSTAESCGRGKVPYGVEAAVLVFGRLEICLSRSARMSDGVWPSPLKQQVMQAGSGGRLAYEVEQGTPYCDDLLGDMAHVGWIGTFVVLELRTEANAPSAFGVDQLDVVLQGPYQSPFLDREIYGKGIHNTETESLPSGNGHLMM